MQNTLFNSRTRIFFGILTLIALGFAAYSNSFEVPFQFDGRKEIRDLTIIRELNPIDIFKYKSSRFFGYFSFAINYALHDINVFGYHLFNLSIHIGTTMIVWVLANLTLSSPLLKNSGLKSQRRTYSFLAAAIFLVHPIQTQAVTYIVQRITSLAGFFYLASVASYAYAFLKVPTKNKIHKYMWLFLSTMLGLCSLFTKEESFSLPIAIGLYHHYFITSKWWTTFTTKTWTIITGLAALPVVLAFALFSPSFVFQSRVTPLSEIVTPMSYFLTQLRVFMTYLRLLFLPVQQNLMYYYPISTSFFELSVIFSFLGIITLLFLAWQLYTNYRLISFAILWFFVTLSVSSSFIPINDVIFEHRLYLPVFGFSLALIEILWVFLKPKHYLLRYSLIGIILIFGLLTYNRNFAWQSEFAMWLDIANKSPQIPKVHNNLGTHYVNQNNLPAAVKSFQTAIRLEPRYASPYYNLGYIYFQQNQLEVAEKYLIAAAQLDEKPDRESKTHTTLGLVYREQELTEQAIQAFSIALQNDPNNPVARQHLAELTAQ